MAYFKLTILSIMVFIGLMHGPVHVSCYKYPPPPRLGPPTYVPKGGSLHVLPVPVPRPVPVIDRRSDERRTVLLVDDNGLQDGGLSGGFGGGFEMLLPLLFLSFLLMSLGVTTNTAVTNAMVTSTTADVTTATTTTTASTTTTTTATTTTTPTTTTPTITT